jgi:hypothetical protein
MRVVYITIYKRVVHIDNVICIILKTLFKPMYFMNVATNVENEYCISYNLYKL